MHTTLRFLPPGPTGIAVPTEPLPTNPDSEPTSVAIDSGSDDQTDVLLTEELPGALAEDRSIGGTMTYVPTDKSPAGGTGDGTPLPAAVGRYRIDGEIAHGGMGVVWRGWDPLVGREVAIKMLHRCHLRNPALVRRFLDEARISGRLQHPGIVPVHELGLCPDGQPYFVMNLVRGQTLDQVLAGRASVTAELPRLLKVFEQVCQAVAFAHANGVIHRDLKPANIMVGDFGVVMVMDWGLAKVLGDPESAEVINAARESAELAETCGNGTPAPGCSVESGTQIGTVFGTPAYLPPEQAKGDIDQVNQRADVFGLGGLLCEILTGLPPYVGTSIRSVYRKAVRAKLADALNRLKNCPAERAVVEIAERCLCPDPGRRPADAGEVARAMTAYLESDQRRAERDLVRCFDVSLDLFCVAGLDGYFKRVNANFPRVLGYTAEELVSKPFVEFVHPDDEEATKSAVARLSIGQPVVQFRNRYRHAKGHHLWIEWTSRSIPEEGVIYAVARDVTEQVSVANLLGETATVLLQKQSLPKMLQQCADLLLNHVGNGLVRIWTTHSSENALILQASAGSHTHLNGPQARAAVGQSEIDQIVRERKPFLSNGEAGDPRLSDQAWATREGMVAFAGYPLIVADRLVGVLVILARHSFSNTTLDTLKTVSDSLALGVLHKQIEQGFLRLNAKPEA